MASYPSARRSVGILGGSFDPVHIAHLIIAQDAVEQLNLSEVLFVPASIPPHKQHIQKVDAGHRLEMLRLAVKTNPLFSVSDLEVKRGGISYSIDTFTALHELRSNDELVMIIGSDTLMDLHNWYKIDELLSLCEVATFMRPGEHVLEQIHEKVQLAECHKEKLLASVFDTHLIEISSTEIRRRVAKGQRIHYLVPPEVEQYVIEQGLYKG